MRFYVLPQVTFMFIVCLDVKYKINIVFLLLWIQVTHAMYSLDARIHG